MKLGNLCGTHIYEVTPEEKEDLGINFGIKIAGPISGLLAGTHVNEGFIITKVDGKPANSVKLQRLQLELEQGSMIEGFYPDGTYTRYYSRGFHYCN